MLTESRREDSFGSSESLRVAGSGKVGLRNRPGVHG